MEKKIVTEEEIEAAKLKRADGQNRPLPVGECNGHPKKAGKPN